LGFTEALSVPPDGVIDVVGCDVTVGALDDVPVVNDSTAPYVVPEAFVATAWK
jgi:hypothetical protein